MAEVSKKTLGTERNACARNYQSMQDKKEWVDFQKVRESRGANRTEIDFVNVREVLFDIDADLARFPFT